MWVREPEPQSAAHETVGGVHRNRPNGPCPDVAERCAGCSASSSSVLAGSPLLPRTRRSKRPARSASEKRRHQSLFTQKRGCSATAPATTHSFNTVESSSIQSSKSSKSCHGSTLPYSSLILPRASTKPSKSSPSCASITSNALSSSPPRRAKSSSKRSAADPYPTPGPPPAAFTVVAEPAEAGCTRFGASIVSYEARCLTSSHFSMFSFLSQPCLHINWTCPRRFASSTLFTMRKGVTSISHLSISTNKLAVTYWRTS